VNRREICTGFWYKNLKRPAEELGTDGRVLKWILRILWYVMKWSHLAQNRDQWGALLNMVKTLQLHKVWTNYLTEIISYSKTTVLHSIRVSWKHSMILADVGNH